MDKQTEEILQKIEEAEYVLVGLGQEFDMEFFLQSREDYRRIREQLQQQNVLWLLPYVEEHFRRQYLPEMEAEIEKGLQKLAEVLEKNVIEKRAIRGTLWRLDEKTVPGRV